MARTRAQDFVEKSRGILDNAAQVFAEQGMDKASMSQIAAHAQVSKALLDRALNQLGGKRLGVWVGKRIPFVGGGVGAAVDGWSTLSIARHAEAEFPSRRPKLTGVVVEAD